MKRVAGLAIILSLMIVLVLLASCRKDVFVEPPESLAGDYQGIYSYKINDQLAEEQPITWRFTGDTYRMYYDEANDPDSTQLFCNMLGKYTLGSGVELAPDEWNLTQDVCTDSMGPYGAFALDQSTDTLKMTQVDDAQGITKTIRLINLTN